MVRLGEIGELFFKGGVIMYPLLLCSIISLAVFIERVLFLSNKTSNGKFLNQAMDALSNGERIKALNLAQESQGDCAHMVASCLQLPCQAAELESILETQTTLMVETYEDRLDVLSTIITMAPLLGLLGTIIGMISSFKILDVRSGQPFAITGGIAEALIATAFGLTVALFSLVLYGILKRKIASLNKQLVQCCLALQTAKRG